MALDCFEVSMHQLNLHDYSRVSSAGEGELTWLTEHSTELDRFEVMHFKNE